MTEPMLDGKPVGPGPDELRELYVEGIVEDVKEAMHGGTDAHTQATLEMVRRCAVEGNLEDVGLRAVYEAGRESILRQLTSLDVVMTTLPHAHGEFVELEDEHGRSVGTSSGIDWIDQGDTWALRIPKVLLP